jgi:DNA polymerase III subunit beta
MKLTCTQENLKQALFILERVVGKQSSLPILSNILLETEQGQLRLSATNLEIGVSTSIGSKIESEGRITIPAKLLGNFVQNLSSDQIILLEQVGMQLILSSGNYTVKINGMDGKDFPIIPEYKGTDYIALQSSNFSQGLEKTLFCISTNESRPELTGALLAYSDEHLFLTATDSFRLAEWGMVPLPGTEASCVKYFQKDHVSVIIPLYTLQELARVISPQTKTFQIALHENQIFFVIDGVRIVSRLINGRFPEYRQIIPQQFSNEILLEKDEFQRALRIATSFSQYSSGEVLFRVVGEEHLLELKSFSQGVGEQIALLPYEGNAEGGTEIIFNPRYILDGVAALDGEKITLSYNAPTTPVRLSIPDSQDQYTYIIMPIRH